MSASPEEDGFAQELTQSSPQHASPRSRTDFAPWHKPRKFWLRKNQWQAEARSLLKTLNLAARGRPVTYLTLPGPDLLDVRGIQGVCEEANVNLRYLGFMSGDANAKTELSLSMNELQANKWVDRRSSVLPDQFQSLAEHGSVGFQSAESIAPFDIINIDLCGAVADSPPLDKQQGYYDALQQIVLLQKKRRSPDEPWLLFLTTRCNSERVNVDAASKLFEALLNNYAAHQEFREASHTHLRANEDKLRKFAAGELATDPEFETTFAAAVCKWLLGLLSVGRPACTVEVLPTSVTYGVIRPAGRDMISLGFLCRTIVDQGVDPAGLANSPGAGAEANAELNAAIALVASLDSMKNVDVVLGSRADYEAQVSEAATAMEAARFDRVAYTEWAMGRREAPREHAAPNRGHHGSRSRGRDSRHSEDRARENRVQPQNPDSAIAIAMRKALDNEKLKGRS